MSNSSSDDQQPVMWLGDRAIYASYFVVLVYVVSMLATTLLMAFNVAAPLVWLPFDSSAVLRGEVWRILTYGLVNPPSLWFVVDMFFLAWFGREVEKFFGRRIFLQLFGCLYLVSPLLFTALGLRQPMYLAGETGSLAIFVAFATVYPGVVMLFNILAKWFAIVLVGIYTLMNLAGHNVTGLIALWVTTGFAFVFVRYQQGRLILPRFKFRRRISGTAKAKASTMSEMDALLDKIANSGISSLTSGERAKLEAGRASLVKRKNTGRD